MGLFIGASILTVLELFDYAYEVIKHKLCRRGKCQKEAKRSSADKGVALSLDDVKRHVRERARAPSGLPLPPTPQEPPSTPAHLPLPPPSLLCLPNAPALPEALQRDDPSLSCALPLEPMREPPGPPCRDDIRCQHPTSPSSPRHVRGLYLLSPAGR
ncbi:hypothetical protein P7K49_019855 [Saguinus oedipus]|uniref:Uncharacterized protein n=1 Tax=Saguinus oedipus TaxID=9490 RepID=A0ABQ9V0C5_SAGOE|nr:hypothetical protein P7K49_019855 [Saguinus oedipus]